MLTPVVLFVYARPDHTKKVIESLAANTFAKDTEVIIYSDAAKNDKVVESVQLVRTYIDTIPEKRYFKNVEIIKAKTNLGLANSVISGISKTFERYEKVIVLEDDLLTSIDFLSYMNNALDYYTHHSDTWSISGYTFPIDIPSDYKSNVYLSYRGSSWGWATWKDRWERVDWDVSDYNIFRSDRTLRRRFNRGGRDLAGMLDLQMQGKIDSWAIRWCYAQSKLDMLTVYPVISRINNIGLDGSGTHSGISTKYNTSLNVGNQMCRFDKPELDSRILRSFKDKFGTKFEHILYVCKIFIRKIIIQ